MSEKNAQAEYHQPDQDPTEIEQIPEEVLVTNGDDEFEVVPTTEEKKTKFVLKRWHKIGIGIGLFFVLVTSILAVLGIYSYNVAIDIKAQAQEAAFHGQAAYSQFKAQNLPGAQSELNNVEEKLTQVQTSYQKLSFYRFFPFINKYYYDGIHGLAGAQAGLQAGLKSLETIAPYADVLGFAGEGTFEGGTAEDRLKLVLETLEKVTPELDAISANLQTMEDEFAQIDSNRYPEQIRGMEIKSRIDQVKSLSNGANLALTQYRPFIEKLPEIMGAGDQRKKYLVLFTNDGELRATGGFLTAYSIIFIENGKVTPEKSDDIYELDQKFSQRIEIPEQLGRYLTTESYWHLRDMNIYPDFKQSMETFLEHYSTIKSEPQDIDGIIAIDTNVLTGLLEVLGPVEVPGYGTFSAQETDKGIPQVVYALSEIITRPTPYLREDRKGILGPMMRAILTKAYGAPKQQWPDLFTQAMKLLESRDAQIYFIDEQVQAAAEAINVAGKMELDNGNDFLAVVNSNLGGAKSNFFISSEMDQVIDSAPVDGMIEKTVIITYKNNQEADNCNLEAGLLCLNSTNRDWTRLYVPKGSELIEAQGFNEEAVVYDEGDFTIIEGFFLLEPMSQAKLNITYKVPYTDEEMYRVRIWKQGGVDPVPVMMEVTGGQEELTLDKDIDYAVEW